MPLVQLPSIDWALKCLLESETNFRIVEGFLSELLYDSITVVEFLDPESRWDRRVNRFKHIDLKARNRGDETIMFEIQFEHELDFQQRLSLSETAVADENKNRNSFYKQVDRVISVSIFDFELGQGDDYIYKGDGSQLIGLHTKQPLALNNGQWRAFKKFGVDQVYPEYYLIILNYFNDIPRDTLDEWIYFLKNESNEESFQAKGLKQAREQLDKLKLTKQAWWDYDIFLHNWRREASILNSAFTLGFMEGKQLANKKIQLTQWAIDKFGPLPLWAEERLHDANKEQLQAWSNTFLKAEALEEWLG